MLKLVIIDGNAILHRAFHALPPLTTTDGKLVNAVFGFTSMLIRVVHDLRPTHLIVTFDRPKPTFRKQLFVGYQAKRPKMKDELSGQIGLVHELVTMMGIPIFEMDGYEADDVIGTLAEKIKTQSESDHAFETIIVTGDRDLLQLVDTHTKVYMPVKGISESKLFSEKEVKEKFGISPAQMVDYKSLVGDQSDNYPGVAGIGPKTARDLLAKFNTLEHLYTHLGDVESQRIRMVLAENAESAGMAKKLATIVRDVPIEVDFKKCKLKTFDKPNVRAKLEELSFRSLIPRLGMDDTKITHNRKQITDNKKPSSIKSDTEQIRLF